MRNYLTRSICVSVAIVASAAFLSGCVDLADSGYNRPSYDDYSYGHDDYYRRRELERERDRARHERNELREERERAEEARERLERERERERAHVPPPPPRREERCPSGFSPSENKCSKEERRRGCQDMRLPGGLGCVKR